jgi:glycosyltransferase involved in cell wall biosynthesis
MSRMAPTDQQRIMMIAPTPYFSDRGCHVRIFEEAQGLIAAGHQVRVVTYPLGRDVEPVPVVRTIAVPWYTKHGAGPSWHKPYLDLLLCLRALREVRRFRPTVIHAHLHEGALIGWVIARLSGVPLLFDYQGSLSGELLHHGSYRRGGVLHRCFRRLEQCINGLATMVVTSSTAGAAASAGTKAPETKSPSANSPKAVARTEDAATKQHPADVRKPAVPERFDDERFIVQVGAFADADKAREVRVKLERAGLKTYTQVVDSKDGKRTRVRVGPYSSRAEADKAAARIKGLDLSASILTL